MKRASIGASMSLLSLFFGDERGLSATEYGLVTAVVVTVVGLALGPIAWKVRTHLDGVLTGMEHKEALDDR
jgi:Flp pilus assembly pilin Flp